jgi:hypothetical protein
MIGLLRPLLCLLIPGLLAQCSSGPREWTYRYERGKTAILLKDLAVPPTEMPTAVKRAATAGNDLRKKPYLYGGGHAQPDGAKGYDCSGAVSYVLRKAGLMSDTATSDEFRHWGESGAGDWITVYAKRGHVFIIVAGLRLDTHTAEKESGPRWTQDSRSLRGFRARHPPGL